MEETLKSYRAIAFRCTDKIVSCIFLKKKIPLNEEHGLGRVYTWKDGFLITLGVVLAAYYRGLPLIISTYGYMTFFPLLMSGLMSFITCMCFAELVAMNANTGGSYRYVYYTMGELPAFLVGWTCLYTSILEIVSHSITMITTIDDNAFDGALKDLTLKNLPIGGLENYFLQILPNVQFENLIPIIFLTATNLGFAYGKYAVNVAAFLNLLIVLACMTIFWFFMDLSKFNILGATKDFSFFTEGSIIGHLFYMDFEVAMYAGAETINPNVTLPKSMVEGFKWGFTFYMVSIVLYSAREGAADKVDDNPAMNHALTDLGFKNFYVAPLIGHVLSHFVSSIASWFEGSRVIYTMAKDGLMFSNFSRVNPKFRYPVCVNIYIAVICCFVAIFIGVSKTTRTAIVAGETIVRIMVLISYLLIRYSCQSDDEHYEDENKKRWVLINCPHSLSIPTKTTSVISRWLIYLSVISTVLAEVILAFYIVATNNKQIYLRIIFIITVLIIFISVHLLNQQPLNDHRHLSYRVRGLPYTPMLAIAWYILILMFLSHSFWLKILLWLIIGLIFYFSYAFMRSEEYINRMQETNSTNPNTTEPSLEKV